MKFIIFGIIFGASQISLNCYDIKAGQSFRLFKNIRCNVNDYLGTLSNVRSQTTCFGKCATLPECVGVNYGESSRTCELISSFEMTCSEVVDTDWNHGYLDCKSRHNRDCQTLRENGCWQNGVYSIKPDPNQSSFDVYCDMQDGGWTVIQRRFDNSVDFHKQNWTEYKVGFGDISAEHWLGNDYIHLITNSANYQIKFDLMTPDNVWRYAVYSSFSIQDETADYELSIGSFIDGSVGDVITNPATEKKRINGMKFTTFDRDNDLRVDGSCAQSSSYNGAGWWYNCCTPVNPNGRYSIDGVWYNTGHGIKWAGVTSQGGQSLMATTMKLKRFT